MKSIGYVRVSSEKQCELGVSLEAQTAKIRAMASVQGAELVDIIVDGGESAKSLERPGVQRLLELVRGRKVDTVIVTKLDRLTRSVRDLADLLELFNVRGVALVSVAESLDTATAAGRLVINLLISVSQWEREAIGERTRFAMAYKKSVGERVGNIAYGFQISADNRHVEPNPIEQRVVARIVKLKNAGLSLRKIANKLNAEGFTTRRGSAWHHAYVFGVLRTTAGS
jgi:site-specific DNA recombinase